MLQNIKAICFDLDGTLIDSMWMWEQIDIEFLGRFGISLPENLQRDIAGMSFPETANYFKTHFPLPLSEEEMMDEWNRMAWDKYENEVRVKPGVKEFLEYCRQNGIKMGIGTSNSRELVELCLKPLGIREYFQTIRTAAEVAKGKPAPDIYELVAGDLQVEPEQCIVFEDVLHGVLAGKNAGMRICAVYDKNCFDREEDIKKEADYYIESFEELKYLYEEK